MSINTAYDFDFLNIFVEQSEDLEVEIIKLVGSMELDDRLQLARSKDLPRCIYEILLHDESELVKTILIKSGNQAA